jgi:hypothetical protein
MLSIRTFALAACLTLVALPAFADPMYIGIANDASDNGVSASGPFGRTWKAIWLDGWNKYEGATEITIDRNTLGYFYSSGPMGRGTPSQTYVFGTTAASAGTFTFDVDLSSNEQWNGSSTSMYVWQGDVANTQWLAGATADAVVRKTVTLNLGQGEAWGFKAVSGSIDSDNPDYSGALYGAFSFVDASTGNQVPEPASLALLGLGLGALALTAARRKG